MVFLYVSEKSNQIFSFLASNANDTIDDHDI